MRWVILDASSLVDIDYSAGVSLAGLLDYLDARGITFALARADNSLLSTLQTYGLKKRILDAHVYANLIDAVHAFQAGSKAGQPNPQTRGDLT